MNESFKRCNCYQVLRVSPAAPFSQIRKAYLSLSRRFHPDVSRTANTERQVELNLAYEVLTDPVLRGLHDAFWYKARPVRGAQNRAAERPDFRPDYLLMVKLRKKVRAAVRAEEARIRGSMKASVDQMMNGYEKHISHGKLKFFIRACISLAVMAPAFLFLPLFLPGLLIAAILLSGKLKIKIDDADFFLFSPQLRRDLSGMARRIVNRIIGHDMEKLKRHEETLALLRKTLLEKPLASDSEDRVTLRLVSALFFMGYVPVSHDRSIRILRFTSVEGPVMVRYRHRTGKPVSLPYIQKLTAEMRMADAKKAYLFASPGLSGNAKKLASEMKISCYTLHEMHRWIYGVIGSDYSGPHASILDSLDRLHAALTEQGLDARDF